MIGQDIRIGTVINQKLFRRCARRHHHCRRRRSRRHCGVVGDTVEPLSYNLHYAAIKTRPRRDPRK